MRLSQVAKKLNVGISTIVDHLATKGHEVVGKPNTKINDDQFSILEKEFQSSAKAKAKAAEVQIGQVKQAAAEKAEAKKVEKPKQEPAKVTAAVKLEGIKVIGKIDLEPKKKVAPKKEALKAEVPKKEAPKKEIQKKEEAKKDTPKVETPKVVEKPKPAPEKITADSVKLEGIKVVGKIDLEPKKKTAPKKEAPKAKAPNKGSQEKKTQKAAPSVSEQKPKVDKKETPVLKALEVSDKSATKEVAPIIEATVIEAKAGALKGLTVLGKIELPAASKKKKPVASSDDRNKKRKRKRVRTDNKPGTPAPSNTGGSRAGNGKGPRGSAGQAAAAGQGGPAGANRAPRGKGKFVKSTKGKAPEKTEVSAKEIQDKIKATMARMSGGGNANSKQRSKYRKDKRSAQADVREEQEIRDQEELKFLKVTEFISANELANLMDVSVNDVISTCMTLGMFVSINQRLDAEAITVIADEFNFEVKFISEEEDEDEVEVEVDAPEDLQDRAPVVTIMGHVDHGKTSLLDYIRESDVDVTKGEAGGITQHIGAYSVKTKTGKQVTFLDTPGHEAFTAMRARGTKLTDIVILVVAADDRVMPQTKEAINHAQLAGVPIIVALNKCDKSTANPDKIREELSKENIIVEDWGGKYQCQEVSAKSGLGIDELLEKVLIEAEMLELKANPDKQAIGAVVEASLDKGRGYLSTVLVQSGTLKIGDIVMAGAHYGRVKALMNHKGSRLKVAGPSMPVQVLGLAGAPQAGDKFTVADTDREAREITTKRGQILREQSVRAQKHLTLDEIGRRLAIGNFRELNLIIKGDVDGSVEALTDSLLKLSTEEVQVNIIHKAVGQITESDVLLAAAADAIILGFQVRPSSKARDLAENEQIEIKQYSIIYKAIDDIKDALEGLLAPKFEEVNLGNIEIRDVFKISKVGTVAGCYVLNGVVKRNSSIRIIREGIVKYTGEIGALKRFKDDVSEVRKQFECGLSIKGYNDLEVGDIIEAFEEREIKRKL
jgi:translation initiation factor IF-2